MSKKRVLSSSTLYQERRLNAGVFITTVYQAFLGRLPNEQDLDFYLSRIPTSNWPSLIVAEIATSAEAQIHDGDYAVIPDDIGRILKCYQMLKPLPLGMIRWIFLPRLSQSTLVWLFRQWNGLHKEAASEPTTELTRLEARSLSESVETAPPAKLDGALCSPPATPELLKLKFMSTIRPIASIKNLKRASYRIATKEQLHFSTVISYLQQQNEHAASIKSPTTINSDHLDNELFVRFLYRWLLHRPPDTNGLLSHLSKLAAGLSRDALIADFLSSLEYADLVKKLGVSPKISTTSPFHSDVRKLLEELRNPNVY